MQLRKLTEQKQAEVRLLGKLRFGVIRDSKQVQFLSHLEIDGIIVEDLSFISNIRKIDELYLKPLFFHGESHENTDGAYHPDNIFSIITKTKKINLQSEEFEHLKFPSDQQEKLAVKLLRYSLSRNKSINAKANRHSKISYNYALLEDFSIEKNPLNHLRFLEDLASKDFFSKEIIDRVNLCYECQSNYLNFSETCTKCGSLDLKTENLVHHFRCAYIGPESDFNKEGTLQCPKCAKQLKHIGIDYDKPSEIHTCNSCTHTTQETTMKAKCVDCGESNHLNQITTRDIYSFNTTEKGRQKALESNTSSPDASLTAEVKSSAIPNAVYEILKSHELQKSAVYQNELYEMNIQIHHEIKDSLKGQLIKNLLAELSIIISNYLNTHDLITVIPTLDIQALLIDYSKSNADELVDILDYNLTKMLIDNNWIDKKPISIELTNF